MEKLQVDEIFNTYTSYRGVGVRGFFEILSDLRTRDIYKTTMGNPIETWLRIVGNEVTGLTSSHLDTLYLMRSGEKYLIRRIVKELETVDTSYISSIQQIYVQAITRKYSHKWLELWDTMYYEYEPLWNYDMTEVLSDEITEYEHGHVEELSNGKTNTRTGSITDTPGVEVTETEMTKGWDSSNWVDKDKRITGQTGNNQTLYNQLKDTLSGTDTTTHSGTDTQTKNYTLTRTGNIGVTTSMDLIKKQREIVTFNYFDEIVFPDIDKELTLSVY